MARSGYLPKPLSKLSPGLKTPIWALVAGGIISIIALYADQTAQYIVILSAMGAVFMYMMSMISLFILRKKEPALERPFRSPFYPVFPAIALVISAVALFAIIWFHFLLSLFFFGGLAVAIAIFVLTGKHKVKNVISPTLEYDLTDIA